jgi:carbonic anhydrase/acetyltransferase-like protein (isoleucine patch superfamily)
MTSKWRALTAAEINQITTQGCTCSDWSKVQVTDGFNPERVKTSHFSGDIRLGVFQKDVKFESGLTRPSGISNATIHNCFIGDNVYINEVKSNVANYQIDDDVVIENIDMMIVEGRSSFGNGSEVAVINEAGGREIPIYDRLSAQLAYIIALYRHRPKLIEKLRAMIAQYAESVTSSMGFIGAGAKIINARTIKNVKIGPAAVIEAASRLENGSINSCPQDPVYIGPGVFAHNFIACSGSKVSDGAILAHCFVGQATELAKQYSAENSVFFANCGGFHGEACSIFAGPYTVTHHKSTLLIAGLFSFLNAGSGTNQSNHMYKLGPAHQGIVERGSKTASDSYMLWPAKVGAFTVVMGRHYRNSDTSDLPFSYLIEHEDESILAPGVNLRSVGTVRDAKKWPKRDKRKDPNKLDLITFKLLSPYTIQKMLNGLDILNDLQASSGQTCDYFTYHSVKIENAALHRGIKLYQIGTAKFLGNCLIKRLEAKQFSDVNDLRSALKPQTEIGPGKWLDIAGQLIPEEVVNRILADIESGKLASLDSITQAFVTAHESYPAYEWAWAVNILQQKLGKTVDAITAADIINMTERWKAAVVELDNMLAADTAKEFTQTAQIGFGIDGDQADMAADFAAVRGTFDDNSVVKEIKKHIEDKTRLAEELIRRIEKIR